MKLFKSRPFRKLAISTRIFFPFPGEIERHHLENFPSRHLKRPVKVDVLLPPSYFHFPNHKFPALYLNDGQDIPALNLLATLGKLFDANKTEHFVTIAIHAGDRMQEYGTAGQPDYQGRGSKAQAYAKFLRSELIPAIQHRYRIKSEAASTAIAGFSLGGLSALDLAWKNPDLFGHVGVFSGSLWWRATPFQPSAPDADRIAHTTIEKGPRREKMRFWLQAGTNDEVSDRNNNGIIDAIDDTMDLIKSLEMLGYQNGKDIKYLEVPGGEHNPHTWGKAMPDFLRWAYGRK